MKKKWLYLILPATPAFQHRPDNYVRQLAYFICLTFTSFIFALWLRDFVVAFPSSSI